ncbi:MAG: hypothetical protein ACOXZV_00735 [Bacteroidales bacterium]|jgi:hypothetical protein
MERAALINIVKIKLDEFSPEDIGHPFDDYIGPMLNESAREILERAPLHLLSPVTIPISGTIFHNNKAYIPVPADYVRLYEIKYPQWKKSVRKAISAEDPQYKIQENEYIKAGYARPAVAIVRTTLDGSSTIRRYFECGKVEDNTISISTPVALYIRTTLPEELEDILADTLTWLCTSKVLSILGYGDKAAIALESYKQSLMALST